MIIDFLYYAPAMTSVTPVHPFVGTYVHKLYVRMSVQRRPLSKLNIFDQNFMNFSSGPLLMKIHHLKRCPVSNLNIFYKNFMKLGHIV